jgi:glycosyltransferase involved in cell wall biosynthesis
MKIAVIVPTHNEPQRDAVIAQIRAVIGPRQEVSVYNDSEGIGKGYALQQAIKGVKADYYIFIDGDGDIDPNQIRGILAYLFIEGYDIVVGKKQLPVRWDRRMLTFASRIWIKLLFGITVDTQTGIKGFNYRPEWIRTGWAFDIEILWKAKKMGKRMAEIPVFATVSSGKSAKDILSTLVDTIKIRMGL